MENLEATYNSLITLDSFDLLSNEDAFNHISLLINSSFALKRLEGLETAIERAYLLLNRHLTPFELFRIHYLLGNSWRDIKQLSRQGTDLDLKWDQIEIEKGITHYRKALLINANHKLKREVACPILTNLGNLFSHIGRFVEAIEYWNQVLSIFPSFPMALGNRGYGLAYYAKALYDNGQAVLFLKYAYNDLNNALKSEPYPHARKAFEECKNWIELVLKSELEKPDDVNDFSLGDSENEISYRRWCLKNRLFLNPLNDLGTFPIAACDIFTTPSIVVDIEDSPYYPGFFNQMKQEFVSARYLYYDGINSKEPHFSDKDVLLYDTLDYPSYSLSVEKIKASFRILYSLFDKIAYFLNDYMELNIPKTKVSFRTFWYDSLNKKKGLRADFKNRQNWPLRGLFWLSKDLFEDNAEFKEAMEPDAKEMHDIRNHIEHKYFKLHGDYWHEGSRQTNKPLNNFVDPLSYSMTRYEFEYKTLKLLKLIRSALIYLSLSIHKEETDRGKIRNPERKIVPMPLYILDYDKKCRF